MNVVILVFLEVKHKQKAVKVFLSSINMISPDN